MQVSLVILLAATKISVSTHAFGWDTTAVAVHERLLNDLFCICYFEFTNNNNSLKFFSLNIQAATVTAPPELRV